MVDGYPVRGAFDTDSAIITTLTGPTACNAGPVAARHPAAPLLGDATRIQARPARIPAAVNGEQNLLLSV